MMTDRHFKRSMGIVKLPYLEDIESTSALNQWSHGQQPTLIVGHLVIVHMKPKHYIEIGKRQNKIEVHIC